MTVNNQENSEALYKNMPYRGEIWTYQYQDTPVRYVVVVSNNMSNMYSPTVTVVSISFEQRKEKLPSHVCIEHEVNDFKLGVILCETIRSVSKDWLLEPVSILTEAEMQKVADAILFQLGLGQDVQKVQLPERNYHK